MVLYIVVQLVSYIAMSRVNSKIDRASLAYGIIADYFVLDDLHNR